MPQMAPMSWLSLFIAFTITFLIFNVMNYYSYIPLMPKSYIISKKKENSFLWKW